MFWILELHFRDSEVFVRMFVVQLLVLRQKIFINTNHEMFYRFSMGCLCSKCSQLPFEKLLKYFFPSGLIMDYENYNNNSKVFSTSFLPAPLDTTVLVQFVEYDLGSIHSSTLKVSLLGVLYPSLPDEPLGCLCSQPPPFSWN